MSHSPSDKNGKEQPLWERLRFLVKERRHVQIGVVEEDLIAAANGLEYASLRLKQAPRSAIEATGEKKMKVTDEMVDRFLSWKLPEDFHPDAGISFTPYFNVEYNAKQGLPPARHNPIGTNLLTATQARAMLEHVLGASTDAK